MQRLDIPSLKRLGFFERNCFGTLNWNCNGEPSGSVRISVTDARLIVSYRKKERGSEEWIDYKNEINLLTTECNYGGERKWLECPYCKRRMGVLTLGNDGFACRHCYKVPYASQQESKPDRLMRAQRKLAARMFEDEDRGIKKKGMHWKTFNRLLSKHSDSESAYDKMMLQYCLERGMISEATLFGYRG